MFIATVETRHFSFIALGQTKEQAQATMMRGWKKHCKESGADLDHVKEDDIAIAECRPGQCLRDNQPF